MRIKPAWVCMLWCAMMAGLESAFAAAGSNPAEANPYSVICDRNIFHLVPPSTCCPDPPLKSPRLPKVMLTGFVGTDGSEKILLAILPKNNKEAACYACLVPGQKEHGIQLVAIRLDREDVDIINSGAPETLSVVSNSYESLVNEPRKGVRAPRIMGGGWHTMPPATPP